MNTGCIDRGLAGAGSESALSGTSDTADTSTGTVETSAAEHDVLGCVALCEIAEGCNLADNGCVGRVCARDGTLRPEGPLGHAQTCIGVLDGDCDKIPDCITRTLRFDSDLAQSCMECALNQTGESEASYTDPRCAQARAGCHGDVACKDLVACRNFCDSDPDCIGWCDEQHADALPAFATMMSCAACTACATECAQTPLAQWCG